MTSVPTQTIIFDLGKTLIPFCLEPLQARLEAPGAAPGARDAAQRLFTRFECGRLSAAAFERAICELTRLPSAEFVPWWNSIFEHRLLLPEAWIRSLLARYRCGLLSNTNPLHFAFLSAGHPILSEFAFRILSHEVGAAKPDPLIYQVAEAAAQCPPEAIVYFDDVPDFVAAARKRGWQAYRFTTAAAVQSILPGLNEGQLRPHA
ncbi:MAG: HAD-IA family hydrolase [Terriglobales bacterium]